MTELTEEKIDEIRKNFEYFDEDKNGFIDTDEFGELLKALSPNITPKQIERGFRIVDENGDGLIDYDEFVAWWRTTWWEY